MTQARLQAAAVATVLAAVLAAAGGSAWGGPWHLQALFTAYKTNVYNSSPSAATTVPARLRLDQGRRWRVPGRTLTALPAALPPAGVHAQVAAATFSGGRVALPPGIYTISLESGRESCHEGREWAAGSQMRTASATACCTRRGALGRGMAACCPDPGPPQQYLCVATYRICTKLCPPRLQLS